MCSRVSLMLPGSGRMIKRATTTTGSLPLSKGLLRTLLKRVSVSRRKVASFLACTRSPEIGGIQAGLALIIRGDGESFIDGARRRAGRRCEVVAGVVNYDDPLRARSHGAVEARGRRTDTAVPADNRPILGCKEEASRSRRRYRRQHEEVDCRDAIGMIGQK